MILNMNINIVCICFMKSGPTILWLISICHAHWARLVLVMPIENKRSRNMDFSKTYNDFGKIKLKEVLA